MLLDRVCRECKRSFEGGPRAFYCPECRLERQRKSDRESKARSRKGQTRKLGSDDNCERCGKVYTINAALQRFCEECQPIHHKEYDRITSLEFYHENKDNINPVRNKRRKAERRKKKTDIIGQKFARWTVLKEVKERNGERYYLCRCDCGTEKEVRRNSLVTGNSKSCGCLRKERMKETQSKLPKVDGIDIKNFKNKTRAGSKTGHKGVAPYGNGKYRAQIGFNGEVIHLGVFQTLEEAVQARKNAEEKYYTPFLKKNNELKEDKS